MESSSQYGEDLIIDKYFTDKYGKEFRGTLLDIGANDGITFSNSYQLIEKGWIGDLVEPCPEVYSRLKELHRHHPHIYTYSFAIGIDGEVTLYESGEFLKTGSIGLLSTLLPEETYRFPEVNFVQTKVYSHSFEFFSKVSAYRKWDFITIDTEGMDLFILRQINLKQVECKCLCVEYNGKDKEHYVYYAEHYGMRLINDNGINLIFGL